METLQKMTEEFQRQKLEEILSECTIPQQELFHKIFGKVVPADKLVEAYSICERTIKKRNKVK